MKNNYPIKYALMPIIEQTGWTHGMHELEREYGVVCYIISKCYVIKETKKYNINGTTDIKYQVVFPYYLSNTNRKYRFINKQEIEQAIKNINDEMEEAQEEYSKLFEKEKIYTT